MKDRSFRFYYLEIILIFINNNQMIKLIIVVVVIIIRIFKNKSHFSLNEIKIQKFLK